MLYEVITFLGTLDGRLVAIDRVSGEQQWAVQTTDPELLDQHQTVELRIVGQHTNRIAAAIKFPRNGDFPAEKRNNFV